MKHKLIISGGGPAGLMAAISAHDSGMDTAIVEGNDRVGKKLLGTGNGRCNITNKFIDEKRYYSENPGFPAKILNAFTLDDTVNFFNTTGLPLITLEEGKMFPMSLQASSVLDLLRLAIEERNIPVYCNSKIKEIFKNRVFILKTGDKKLYECDRLILATGGKSVSSTGSDGSGFSLAIKLGHSVVKPLPSLVQLKLDCKYLKALSGIKFDGEAEIYINKESKRKEKGEILFTDYGISGPPVLQLSRFASSGLSSGQKITVKVNILYTMKTEETENFLENRLAVFNYRTVHDSFIGVINKKLIPVLLKEACIKNNTLCSDLTWKEKKNLLRLLNCWEFPVRDTNGFNNSQVTAGGVNTKEVDEKTLESKIVSGLYFAGEILDVDGDSGGFNLQWAWSSGYVAGKSAANRA
ncbi:MAG: NAD(P)/FAD-dependent oxidoreductase [Candidatus Eremiobacterota bacterium]